MDSIRNYSAGILETLARPSCQHLEQTQPTVLYHTIVRIGLKLDSMCVQVDQEFSCGHIGFLNIRWCQRVFNGCKGPSHKHDVVYTQDICPDCIRKDNLPKPWVPK